MYCGACRESSWFSDGWYPNLISRTHLAVAHVKARGNRQWRYIDTGQVLIESACTVERTEEALDTLLPLVDGIRYFRFNPGGYAH